MGAANSNVINQTPLETLPVVTFNNADTVYKYFSNNYLIVKNSVAKVEAGSDAWGLKACVGYAKVNNHLLCKLYFCPNGSTLTVTSVKSNGAVTASGCELKNDVNIDMNNDTWKAFADTVNFTYDVATNIVVPAMTLTASPPTPKPTPKPTTPPPSPTKGDWQLCSTSTECQNQCCSSKYSDGVLKCTPVGGFKTSEGCVGSATRRLRGNNEDGVLAADETNTTFMHHAAPVEELGRDVEYGDELN